MWSYMNTFTIFFLGSEVNPHNKLPREAGVDGEYSERVKKTSPLKLTRVAHP